MCAKLTARNVPFIVYSGYNKREGACAEVSLCASLPARRCSSRRSKAFSHNTGEALTEARKQEVFNCAFRASARSMRTSGDDQARGLPLCGNNPSGVALPYHEPVS